MTATAVCNPAFSTVIFHIKFVMFCMTAKILENAINLIIQFGQKEKFRLKTFLSDV
jgi:hypothetical protein